MMPRSFWVFLLLVQSAMALAQIAAARIPRESTVLKNRRRNRILSELEDSDRAQITEMHTQGLPADHINEELGLGKSGFYVKEAIAALKIDVGRGRGKTRGLPRQPKPAEARRRLHPKEMPHAHRAKMRGKKKSRPSRQPSYGPPNWDEL